MVLADGVIDAKELEVLYRIGTESYGLTPAEITQTVRDAGSSFVVPQQLPDKIILLYQMAQIAWADGIIDPSEVQLLRKYIIHMGFEDENSAAIADFLLDSVKNGVSVEEIINSINV